MSQRLLAVGDIHGAVRTFRRLLFDVVELRRSDRLYLLGDYIGRGSDSRGVIDTILALQSDGFDIRPVRGNHDHHLVLAARSGVFEDLLDLLDMEGTTTLKSYGVKHPQEIPEQHLQFLERLPFYRVTDKFVFVHAGINCTLGDPLSTQGEEQMLWDRSGVVDVSKLENRRVVSGHTTRTLDQIRRSLAENHIRIDNGIYLSGVPGKGHLVAVDLGSKQLFVQENIDDRDFD